MFGIFKKTKKRIDFAEHGADIAQAMATLINDRSNYAIAAHELRCIIDQKNDQSNRLQRMLASAELNLSSCESALIRSDSKFDNAVKAARKHKATIRHLQAIIEFGENELRQSDCFIADLKKANHDLSERNKILEEALKTTHERSQKSDPEKLAEFKHSTKIAFEEIRSLIKQSKCSLSALSIIKTRLFGN